MEGMLRGEEQEKAQSPTKLPIFQDLPPSTSSFRPNFASTKAPLLLQGERDQTTSAFSPAFRPQAGPVANPSMHKEHRRTILPEKYHGTSPLQEYLVHFELCAELNHWGSEDKAKYLAVSLRGQAQGLLGSIPKAYLSSFDDLVAALQERFGLEGQTEIFMAELQSRSKTAKESYQELADSIFRLVGKAYPNASSDTMRVLAVQHFIKALTNKDLRVRIKLLKPSSIREAVLAAIEFEAIETAEAKVWTNKEKVRKVTEVAEPQVKPKKKIERRETVQHVKPKQPSPQPPSDQLTEMLQQITTQLSNLQQRPESTTRPRRKVPLDQVECYRCREKGHFASRCEASIEDVRQRQQAFRASRSPRSSSPSGNA